MMAGPSSLQIGREGDVHGDGTNSHIQKSAVSAIFKGTVSEI